MAGLFWLADGKARGRALAAVDFTVVSKAPEGWRGPRPGGQFLAPLLGKRRGRQKGNTRSRGRRIITPATANSAR